MDVGVQIDSLSSLEDRLKFFSMPYETLLSSLPRDKSYFCACAQKHFLKGGNSRVLARDGNNKFLIICENGIASAIEISGFFSKSVSTLWYVKPATWREAEKERKLRTAGLMQDVYRFEQNLFQQIEAIGKTGTSFGDDGNLWLTGYFYGAFHQMFMRWSMRGDAYSDLRSNLIFGQMESLMGREAAQQRFQLMLQFKPLDRSMPTHMQKGFEHGQDVVSLLEESAPYTAMVKGLDGRDAYHLLEGSEAPKKLEEFFAARVDAAEMGPTEGGAALKKLEEFFADRIAAEMEPTDDDASQINRAIGMAAKVIELQIGLASAFQESKGLKRLPEELPLDEYCLAYVVGLSRGFLISNAGADVSEANDWAVMTLSIHHFFGPMGSGQEDQGIEAVKFFLETQQSQLSMRGQMDAGEAAFAIAKDDIKPEALPKSLAAYLSEGQSTSPH